MFNNYKLKRSVKINNQNHFIIKSNNIFILPTRLGFFYSLIILLMLFGSINYDNNLGFLLSFLLTSIGIFSLFATYNNLINLKFSFRITNELFANESACIFLNFIDNTNNNAKYNLNFNFTNLSISNLFSSSDCDQVKVALPDLQRGIFKLPFLTVNTRYPFGLSKAWCLIHVDDELVVFPNRNKINSKPLPIASNLNEDDNSVKINFGFEDFNHLRNYYKGDSLKHIHWKAYAKQDKLYIKEFCQHESTNIYFFDINRLNSLPLEEKLSQLCVWILKADAQTSPFILKLHDHIISDFTSTNHKHKCLNLLAKY